MGCFARVAATGGAGLRERKDAVHWFVIVVCEGSAVSGGVVKLNLTAVAVGATDVQDGLAIALADRYLFLPRGVGAEGARRVDRDFGLVKEHIGVAVVSE